MKNDENDQKLEREGGAGDPREGAGNPWEGFEVISTYSRAQALEDGVIVDVSGIACEAGFRYPAAVTSGVWSVLNKFEGKKFAGQSYQGRLWDLLAVLKMAIRCATPGLDTIRFEPLFIMEHADRPVTVKMWCKIGAGDTPAPVFTIGLAGED